MQKFYLFPAILLVSLFIQCKSGNNNSNSNANTTPSVDTSGSEKSSETEADNTKSDKYDAQRKEKIAQVRSFLQSYHKEDLSKGLIDTMSRQFQLQVADLDNDGKNETFVSLTGPYFCGSGGCTFLLLDHTGRLNTRFTVASYPVIVDSTFTKGWRDLLVQSGGKFHRLKYTGVKYPPNPSVAPIVDFLPSKGLLSIFDSWEERKVWHVF